jgi:hypothetical protein
MVDMALIQTSASEREEAAKRKELLPVKRVKAWGRYNGEEVSQIRLGKTLQATGTTHVHQRLDFRRERNNVDGRREIDGEELFLLRERFDMKVWAGTRRTGEVWSA